MNRGEEDYIKEIYELAREISRESKGEEKVLVPNHLLAESLQHTAQTVSEMVKKLHKQGFIIYTPYKGSCLTKEGREAAIRLIRIHRTWEYFLVKYLGYSWEEVHDEAEGLEHVTSDRLVERLFYYLKEPKYCPLGNPIPDFEGHIEDRTGIRLWFMSLQKECEVLRVADNTKLLKYLNQYKIGIEQKMKVVERDEVSELLHLEIDGKIVVLGKRVAMSIFVRNVEVDTSVKSTKKQEDEK